MRRSEDVLDVLCTFNLSPVSTGTIIATRKSSFMSAWQSIDRTCLKRHKTISEIYPNGNLKVKFKDSKNRNFDSLESLGNVIEKNLGIGELSNRSIGKMYQQYNTDTDDIDGGGD